MDKTELLEQVRRLRGEGMSPKEIARSLGVSPSRVAPMIRTVAAELRAAAGDAELVGCWISSGWSCGLSGDESRGWSDDPESNSGAGGLVLVLVARRHRWDKVSVCSFLTDVYCLGVKNVIGPNIQDELGLRQFRDASYSAHIDGAQKAPIGLAQHLVFGAVEYARGLGFEPPADFGPAADHLGAWQGPSAITFGNNGKPFYISGPNDNPRAVIKTLERAVGPSPNYEYLIGLSDPFTSSLPGR
jgi:hypothetical protein